MKVLCINIHPPAINHPILIEAISKLKVGEIYTVIDMGKGFYSSKDLYVLEEIPSPIKDNRIGFEIECFMPLSNIDETEMVRATEKW